LGKILPITILIGGNGISANKNLKGNEVSGVATVTPPVSLANRRVGFVFRIFQWIWTTAAGQSIVGVNLQIVFHRIGCSKDVGS